MVEPKSSLKPEPLRRGDRVALVSPSSRPYSPSLLQRAIKVIESMELVPVVGEHAMSIHGYMAGTDDERLEDLNSAIADSDIRGIFVLDGGYGAMRLLPDIDYASLAADPRVLVGSDDATSLLLSANQRAGLVVFHGPNLSLVDRKSTRDDLHTAVTSEKALSPVESGSCFDGRVYMPLVKGRVRGRLTGGNLTVISSLLGTSFSPEFAGRLLLLCDWGERNDILDRWMTSLELSGLLERARGVAFGDFDDCGPRSSYSLLSFEELVEGRMRRLSIPSGFALPFGQSGGSRFIPLGIDAELDTESGILRLLEPALER